MQLQLIYDEISEKKLEQKRVLDDFKYSLKNNQAYQTLLSDIHELNGKKKLIEESTARESEMNMDKMDDLKNVLKSKNELMADVALRDLMDGKTVEVEKDGVKYIPVWSVKFKKVK